MSAKPIQCPNCGQPAEGKFCGRCGTSLVSRCSSCGGTVKRGARVCPECGTTLTTSSAVAVAPAPWNAHAIVPWVAIGIATIALAVSLMTYFDRGKNSVAVAPPTSPASLPSSVSAPGQPVDLSTMSPREAADRLFNRVMAASESGNTAEASQFTPMALQAYENLGTLDNDARYHVALIHMTANDIKGTREQVDVLRKSVPNHLLGYMLESQIADRSGNKDGTAKAYKAFLGAYDSEMAMGRVEYQEHMNAIEIFHKAALASVAGKR